MRSGADKDVEPAVLGGVEGARSRREIGRAGVAQDIGTVGRIHLDLHTEVLWAGLHGLVTLMRGGRLPRETHERRIALLLDRFTV